MASGISNILGNSQTTPTKVYKLGDGFRYDVDSNGIELVQQYINTNDSIISTNFTSIDLPNIGDSYDDPDYKFLTAKKISYSYLGDNNDCGKIFTVIFNSKPAIQTYNINRNDLPKSFEVAAEEIVVDPIDNSAATWNNTAAKTEQPLFFRDPLLIMRVTRIIKGNSRINGGSEIEDFIETSLGKAGKINNAEFFGVNKHQLRYDGCNVKESKDQFGDKIFECELVFTCRTRDWNLTINKKTLTWDKWLVGGQDPYEETSFIALFDNQVLNNNAGKYIKFPV